MQVSIPEVIYGPMLVIQGMSYIALILLAGLGLLVIINKIRNGRGGYDV